MRVSPYLETPLNSSAAFSPNLENAGGICGAGVVSASVAESLRCDFPLFGKRRRDSSAKQTGQRDASAAPISQEALCCEFPYLEHAGGFSAAITRRRISWMPLLSRPHLLRRRSLRCDYTQEDSLLRLFAGEYPHPHRRPTKMPS